MRSPVIAAILSFICAGLGQFYNGELRKGWLFIFVIFISLVIFALGGIFLIYGISEDKKTQIIWALFLVLLGLFSLIVSGLLSILDAYLKGKNEDKS